jgi:hypothetical protein
VPSFLGLSIIDRITPFLKISLVASQAIFAHHSKNCQIPSGFFVRFDEVTLKKGQKSPKENASIMHFNIITQFCGLSSVFSNFFRNFSYEFPLMNMGYFRAERKKTARVLRREPCRLIY